MQRGVDLGLLVGAEAVAEVGEPLRQLGPEGEPLPDRHLGVNRPERGNVLTSHLPGDAPGLHQAGLKAPALLPEAHEHCTGIPDLKSLAQEIPCHYRTARALEGRPPRDPSPGQRTPAGRHADAAAEDTL